MDTPLVAALWHDTREKIISSTFQNFFQRADNKNDLSCLHELIFPGRLFHMRAHLLPFLDLRENIFAEVRPLISCGKRRVLRTRLEELKHGFFERMKDNGLETMRFVQSYEFDPTEQDVFASWERSRYDVAALHFVYQNTSVDAILQLQSFFSAVCNRRVFIRRQVAYAPQCPCQVNEYTITFKK